MIRQGKLMLQEILNSHKQPDIYNIKSLLADEIKKNNKKIIVLDDDPTGVQTVYGVHVYTDWSKESIKKGFKEDKQIFFILTNSRSFSTEKTMVVHQEITTRVIEIAKELNKDFLIIIRGDSTLRGHYPQETEVVKSTIQEKSSKVIDGEILCPFFKEGGRYTYNNVHYVKEGEMLVPCGDTEFARDMTFGYNASHLGEWIEEKSLGQFKEASVTYITLGELRNVDIEGIERKLMEVKDYNKIVVNALDYCDLEVFSIALIRAMQKGKNFLFRVAAAFVKVIAGIENKALLTSKELIDPKNAYGGLIIVGSHTQKTTSQLEELKKLQGIKVIAFNSHLVVKEEAFKKELERVIKRTKNFLEKAQTVVICTRRDLLELNFTSEEDELEMPVKISKGTTSIVEKLDIPPKFIIAKGGITASDIGVKGLKVRCAKVAGQIKPGIPVWITDEGSKFPGIPYIIFPGNVGEEATLREIVESLYNNPSHIVQNNVE